MCLKRVLLLLIAVVLVGIATSAGAARFTDLQGSGYESAIMHLADAGIINGYANGSIQPYNTLNRAESLKVILRSQSHLSSRVDAVTKALPPMPLFSDIDQKAWYAPYVEVGFEKGIVKGYPSGVFKPGGTLTVEEAIALLVRSYGEKGSSGPLRTSDRLKNSHGQWFTPYVNLAIEKNLVSSRETLMLGNPITRGQFFDLVYRMRTVKQSGEHAYVETPADKVSRGVSAQPIQRTIASAGQYASSKSFAITLPTLGIYDLSIIHPDDPFTSKGVLKVLDQGVGHLFSYPGEGGKIMVYGHSSGYPWDISEYTKIFRKISELHTGDKAYVTYAGKLYVYEVVREQTVAADDSAPFEPDNKGEELILYTCWPPDSIDERYLVHLMPVDAIASR